MGFRRVGGVIAPPLGLAAILVVATLVITFGAAPVYEASAHLQTSPVLVLREFNAAVEDGAAPPEGSEDSLHRRDLGDLGLAARDASANVGGKAGGSFAVELKGELAGFDVVARAHSPGASADLANAFARALVTRRNERLAQRISDLRASLLMMRPLAARDPAVQRRVANYSAQLQRLLQLRMLSGGGVSIVRDASAPREPVAPRIAHNSLAAALLGLLLGLTPAVAGTSWRRIGRRIHSKFRLYAQVVQR